MASVLYISGLNRHRSPAAEIITNSMAERSGINIVAFSAGLVRSEHMSISPHMAVALGSIGYKVSPARHAIKLLTREMLDSISPDLVLCMERNQKEEALEEFPDLEGKLHTIAAYAGYGDKDFTISRPVHKVPCYWLIDVLPYFLRMIAYKGVGGVDPRDETGIIELYTDTAMKMETHVRRVIERMMSE
ncbi:hypothetical protein HYV82_05010 [Candidatus Woesearchaeota archaeon]|nr:hypothetical protein [Candidatus Woesearchaeota archaeon]